MAFKEAGGLLQSFSNAASSRASLAAVCAVLAIATGCQSFTPSAAPHLRIVDLGTEGATIDVYQGKHPVAYNLAYGSVTSYIPVEMGKAETLVTRAGSQQPLLTLHGSFTRGSRQTLVVRHGAPNFEGVLLADVLPVSSAASPAVRILDEAEQAGPVDVYLVPAGHRPASLRPIASGLTLGAATTYLTLAPGKFSAMIVAAGVSPSSAAALHLSTQIAYMPGSARTLILLDAPASAGLQIIAVDDE